MASIHERAMHVLSPYVGETGAETCVRGTAITLGKTADELSAADLPHLAERIRHLLGPIAPTAVIEQLIADIEMGVTS
jgi:ubiquinone biosynthesis protein UbiJ